MKADTHKQVRKVGSISMIVNIILFGLKYWAGIVSGSIALIADAWDTLADCLSSLVVIVGGKLASKPADKEHPYGHGRIEHFAAIAIGVSLAILSFNFIFSAYDRFISQTPGNFGIIAITITAVSVVAKQLLAQYGFYMSRKTGSAVLKANAWNHCTDSLSSLLIMAGIGLSRYFWWADSVLAVVIALMIAYASFEILYREIRSLLGEEVDPKLISAIESEVYKLLRRDVHIHHFHLHKYGQHKELSCHIKLPPQMTLDEVHDICTKIEIMMMNKFEMIATIHPEPI